MDAENMWLVRTEGYATDILMSEIEIRAYLKLKEGAGSAPHYDEQWNILMTTAGKIGSMCVCTCPIIFIYKEVL